MTRKIWEVMNKIKKCPYCDGEIVRSMTGLWHFDCKQCDRAWKVDNGFLYALFDTGNHIYSIKDLLMRC